MKPFVLDQKITLQRFTATQDEYGEEVQTWADLGAERAKKFQGRGDERRAAGREQGTQVATSMMHSKSRTRGLLVRDRIRLEEHTSERQTLMRFSYAGQCMKKTK